MLHINQYPVWPDGTRKKQSASFGPLSGVLIEKYDATACLDPNDLEGGAIWGVPTYLWINGDGPTPRIAPDPATNMAAVGVGVLPGQSTQYRYPNGVDATAEQYTNAASYRRDAVRALVPGDADDMIMAVKYYGSYQATYGSTPSIFGVGNAVWGSGTGWFIYFTNHGIGLRYNIGGLLSSVDTGDIFQRSAGIVIAVVNRDGNITIWHNGQQGTSAACLAGAMAVAGIGMGANGTGGYPCYAGTKIEWCATWYGVGLNESWNADSSRLIKRLSQESLGLRETVTNSKYWAYTQPRGLSVSNSSFIDHNNRWQFAGSDVPRAGGPRGLVIAPTTRNEVVTGGVTPMTFNPWDTTGMTVTGGVLTVIDDTAALAAAKAEVWGPVVYSFTNATGVPQIVHFGESGAGGAVVPNSLVLLARYVAGAGAELGFWNTTTSAFTAVAAVLDNYALLQVNTVNPPTSGTSKYAIRIPDGCTLYFIGMHRTYLPTAGFPVPVTISDESTPNAYQDVATTEYTPVDLAGSLLVNLAPYDWSGIEPGADTSVLPCVATAGDILHAESMAAGWATSDGATQIQTVAPYVPTAGVYVDVWSAWRGALQYIQQGVLTPASLVTDVYDGVKGMAGALKAQSDRGTLFVTSIEIRQV